MKIGPKAAARGYGRLLVSGSTRYTTPKGKRLKTFATVQTGATAGMMAGGAAGYGIGHAFTHTGHGAAVGAQIGAQLGVHGGAIAGRHYAANKGWTHRDKQRMTVRAWHGIFGRGHK